MNISDMYYPLLNQLNRHHLVLTANRRLAQYLQQQYNHLQQKQKKCWETARILPLKSWFIQQWQSSSEQTKRVLSDEASQLLWRTIIQNDKTHGNLLQLNQSTNLVKQAWENLILWQIDKNTLRYNPKEETQQFLIWAKQFEQLKKDNNQLCWVELPQLLQTGSPCAETIYLAGFNQAPPLIQHFFESLSSHSKVNYFSPENINQTRSKIQLEDREQEIIAMANWAKQKLSDGSKQIICVVPDLTDLRDQVSRIFCETLTQDNKLAGIDKNESEYNLSAGEQFQQLPLIKSALNALRLTTSPPRNSDISELLLAYYINNDDKERCLAAMAETVIVAQQNHQPNQIHYILTQLADSYYPTATLPKRWKAFCELAPDKAEKTFSQWARKISELLAAIGWPGQQSLNSREYQIIERWQTLLLDFASLDQLLPPCTHKKAFEIINYLCQQITFQVKVAQKPIQILGLLEATGIPCEHLWIMGLNSESWPPKSSPNPFLPIALQREYEMPHASSQQELAYAQQLQNQLLYSAQHAITSFSIQEGDKQLEASPLINSIASENFTLPPKKSWAIATKEQLIDDNGPAVGDNEVIRGGSYLLKLQALCPFQAFAYCRLDIKTADSISIGISAIDHGTICHHALDIFWKKIKSQQKLLALTEYEEINEIDDAIQKACKNANLSESYFVDLEKKHLRRLLRDWLSVEKKRPPFKVLEHETQRHIKIDNLTLKIQIDRIDDTGDGRHLIIDYKTGIQNQPRKWTEPRLTEPQLPLYSLFGSQQAVGIAYAELNLASLKFKGIIDNEESFSEVKPLKQWLRGQFNWQNLTAQWQQSLTETSKAFLAGDARVDPCDQQSCHYCQLQALCRINEKQADK